MTRRLNEAPAKELNSRIGARQFLPSGQIYPGLEKFLLLLFRQAWQISDAR
jgi:hypothetical protein